MAQVIHIDEARVHLRGEHVQRALEDYHDRREQKRSDAARYRQLWLRDLRGWPPPFQTAIEPWIHRWTREDSAWFSINEFERCRAHDVTDYTRKFAGGDMLLSWVGHALEDLQEAAKNLRKAKRGANRSVIGRRRSQLRDRQDRLLLELWKFGRRKIDREELEPVARYRIQQQADWIPEGNERRRQQVEEIRDRLARGIYEQGPKQGEIFGPVIIQRLHAKIRKLEGEIRHSDRVLERLQSEPDPLRAWGIYSQRKETTDAHA